MYSFASTKFIRLYVHTSSQIFNLLKLNLDHHHRTAPSLCLESQGSEEALLILAPSGYSTPLTSSSLRATSTPHLANSPSSSPRSTPPPRSLPTRSHSFQLHHHEVLSLPSRPRPRCLLGHSEPREARVSPIKHQLECAAAQWNNVPWTSTHLRLEYRQTG